MSNVLEWGKSRKGENLQQLVRRIGSKDHPVLMVGIYATSADLGEFDDGVGIRYYEPVIIDDDKASQLEFVIGGY